MTMQSKATLVALSAALLTLPAASSGPPPEAPAGFDNQTNGFLSQADFDTVREIFEEREVIEDGLGPVYNAQACAECHQNPVTGSGSQISEFRAGRFDGRAFTDHVGGSLINDRAIDASIQETVQRGNNVLTQRLSLNTLGDGFVECLADGALEAVAAQQPWSLRGTVLRVPVLEAGGALRVGRFGWKNQHASLLSFSADAYVNEMGITSPLQPDENTSNGRPVTDFDTVPDPEEEPTPEHPAGPDVHFFADFMRSTKVPPRDTELAGQPETQQGQAVFAAIGCAHCHTPTLITAQAGTPINGGTFVVPPALGDKTIHPYGDFLLHDVGTGDGIVQNGGPATRNKLRTAPLWGLRTRGRLMHDGLSVTPTDAILRHAGQADPVTSAFRRLSGSQRRALLAFLASL